MKGVIARQMLALCVVAFLPAMGEAFYFRDKIPWQTPVAPSEYAPLAIADGWGSDVLWVDARPDADYSAGHIPNDFSLNEDRWNELLPHMLERWVPGRKVVVYCSSRPSRYFGNTTPLLMTLILFPIYTTQVFSAPWVWALPFLFTFIGGVFADILESRQRKLFLALSVAILITQAALCWTSLAGLTL